MWKALQPPAPAWSVAAPAVAPETQPSVLAPAPPSTGTAAALRATVTFKVIPEEASLVLNGTALPLSARSIPRPDPGASQKVIVHADGYEDETLTIEDSSPASVDVWLSPSSGTGAGTGTSAPHRASVARAAEAVKTEPSKPPDSLPANPY